MRAVDIVIGAGWAAFWLGWVLAARGTKRGQGNWARFAVARIVYIVLFTVLIRLRVFTVHAHGFTSDPVLWGIGLAVWALGLGLAIWARVCIGRNWGMPMSVKADPELVTAGPYRTIRHPIYTGILLGVVGTAIAISPYVLIIAAVVAAYFIYSAFVEERNMARLFPAAYPEYKRSTKMLVPLIF